MEREYLLITKDQGHYSAAQAIDAKPMTVGELRNALDGLDYETPVVIYEGGYGVTHFKVTGADIETTEGEE